jgi:aminodeoxyfutalosine deaminase
MNPASPLPESIASLPKAELHLHLEGTIEPPMVCALSSRQGLATTEDDVRSRYNYADFLGFLDAFKWVTSFLREPGDYAMVTRDLCEQLLAHLVVYAEVTLSVGVMLFRGQKPEANFEAIERAAAAFEPRGLRLRWIFDAVRQFGPDAALRVVQCARNCASPKIVAFGIGGDELSILAKEFIPVYDAASAAGLHRLIHAGEIGGPQAIREAVEILDVERVGHGIAAIHDPALVELLVDRRIPLEICPLSNIRTGALARQLNRTEVALDQHPLPQLFRQGIPVVLSTDDPAMFQTNLTQEYSAAHRMGLAESELRQLVAASFLHAFDFNPP